MEATRYHFAIPSIVGDYIVMTYFTGERNATEHTSQYIVVYDLGTFELIYVGRIPLRNDQGRMWNFDISLRKS